MTRFFCGLDLGQTTDYTALCIVEKIVEQAPLSGLHFTVPQRTEPLSLSYHVRYLTRLPINTPYPAQAEAVHKLLRTPPLPGQSILTVDQTGVGRPVVDMVRAAKIGCDVHAVSIHGGKDVSRDGADWHVPKRDLIACVQIALQTGQLKIAAQLPEAKTLVQEMLNYRVEIDEKTAHDSYNARVGQHDDLVLALCLAVWSVDHIKGVDVW